jgi:hypothetical protein
LITSKFFASELHFHDWKSPEIAGGEIRTVWLDGWIIVFFQAEYRI